MLPRRSLAVGFATLAITLVVAVSGCSSPTPPATVHSSASAAATATATREETALNACGLSVGEPGVTVSKVDHLELASHHGGKPTSVGAVNSLCVLRALELPEGQADLFASNSVHGGYNVAVWSDFAASWSFRDTLTFRVEVYSA